MNLRFVEAFYWVATLRSVSRAAEKLFITQSAMSSRIAALEEELGTLLLDRRDKSFRLTIAGTRFLTHAEKLLELQRTAKAELSGGSVSGELVLRVGAIESVMHSWLTDWLSELRGQHAGLAIELTVETTPLLLDHVHRGVIDLAFAAAPATSGGVRSAVMPSMPMVFIGHRDSVKQRAYTAAQTAAMEIMTFQRGSQPYVALIDLLREAQIDGARIHAISSISAMIELIEAKFGIATLPRAAADRLAASRNVRIVPSALALPPLTIFASYRSDPASIDIPAALNLARRCAERLNEARKSPSKKSMT
ncbi:MAG: LysR family transcriptional regulator [Betaproteobacteria bacterium]|nr:MAG: LysR family transcriptional regulator [Betaproteobacteria bacterium]